MYSTQIGKSSRSWDSREEAYKAAFSASQSGWKYISILVDENTECRVILKDDGGIFIWTPNLEDKWEVSKYFRDVCELNDVIFRN